MEFKDTGIILRSIADSWKDRVNGDVFSEDWNTAMKHCGKVLADELDKCGVPELKPESTE